MGLVFFFSNFKTRALIIAVSSILFISAHADIIKDKESGILEVQYTKVWVTDTLKWRTRAEPMTLRTGKTAAMFYPTKEMWADSLLRTNFLLHEKLYYELNPIGKKGYTPIGGYESEFLFRNVMEGETMVYDNIGGDHCYYIEQTESPVWEIKQYTKEILGYYCQLATCDFRGRKWEAWFTPEIPIKEGPWKLFGLPGLVLEAKDSKSHYSYQATGIATQNLMPVGIKLYVRDEPIKLKSRLQFLKKNYDQSIKGKFVAAMSSMYGNGSQSVPQRAQYDCQETDYPHE